MENNLQETSSPSIEFIPKYFALMPEGETKYYPAKCPKCGWMGSSEECGTSSFDSCEMYCPSCHSADVRETENIHPMPAMAYEGIVGKSNWISVEDRPLFTMENKNWVCTEDGSGEFIAAVNYTDATRPNETLWWIRHCVVRDGSGLCVVGDDYTEPAGWELDAVEYWMPWPKAPNPIAKKGVGE